MIKRRKLNTDTVLGIIGTLFGIVLLIYSHITSQAVFSIPGDVPPFLIPQILLWVLIMLSVLLCISGYIKGGVKIQPIHMGKVIMAVSFMILSTVLMPVVGYLIVAPVAFCVVAYLLNYNNTILIIACSIGVTASLYILLVKLAKMPLPVIPWIGI